MPTFADMLRSNPHGWGMAPPAPERGYPTTGHFTESGQPIPDLSQMPMFGSKGALEGAKVIAEENAPELLALAAGPAGRAVGAGMRAAPTLSAALMAGLGLTASPGEAGDPAGEAMAAQRKLMEQKERLSRQLEDATSRQNQNRPASLKNSTPDSDPNYWNATKEVKGIADQIGALDKQIDALSPEHAFQMEQDQQKAELDKPFAARHPVASTIMTTGAPIASAALAATGIGKIASKGKSLLGELLQARDAGDITRMMDAAAKLKSWNNPARLYSKQAASIVAPATLPMDMRLSGDVIDKYSLPEDSKAQQRAAHKLSDLPQYIKDSEQGIAAGLTAAMLGAKVGSMANPTPRSDASALLKRYGPPGSMPWSKGKDGPSLAELLRSEADLSTGLQAPMATQRAATAGTSTAAPPTSGPSSPPPTGPGAPTAPRGSPNTSPPPSPPPTVPTATPSASGSSAKPAWNPKTQRYHGQHNHFVSGGPPPKGKGGKKP